MILNEDFTNEERKKKQITQKNKIMKWNRNDWQGRSKKQVENNNQVLALTVIVGVGISIIALIVQSLLGL